MSDLKIGTVLATMNRAATAVACVRSLAAQTRPPQLVVVADNGSTDATISSLEGMADLPFELIVYRMPENRGNAGGIQVAMDLCFERGMDAVWVLDDDSWPQREALAALLGKPWEPGVVRHALQVDPRTGRFTWPLQVATAHGWRLVESLADMPVGDFVRTRIAWTGCLLPREVWQSVGPVNGGLFIRGEDEEYPWRIEQAGFLQEAARHAVMDHPGPDNIVRWSVMGKSLFYEKGLTDWKLYYKVRNMVWLKRRQGGMLKSMMMALSYALAAAWFDGLGRLPLVATAVCDGWRGRLGKWSRH